MHMKHKFKMVKGVREDFHYHIFECACGQSRMVAKDDMVLMLTTYPRRIASTFVLQNGRNRTKIRNAA